MTAYGEGTKVDVDQTIRQIKKMLIEKLGARQIQTTEDYDAGIASLMFGFNKFVYKMQVTIPDLGDDEYHYTPQKRIKRSAKAALGAWQTAVRQRWRSIWLRVRCLVDLVELGDANAVHQMLLGYIVLPGGQTTYDYYTPQLEQAYKDKKMPKLLLPG